MANNTDNSTGVTVGHSDFFIPKLVCYVVIFIVGVIGNTLVCLVVCRERKMKNVTNYFIVNLAAADLSVLLICIPFDFGEQVTAKWPYGGFLCRLIYPLQTMATTASVFTLVAISLNRFLAIVYPLRPQLSTSDAKKIIGVIWLLSVALVSPYIAVLKLIGNHCNETFKDKGMHGEVYTFSIFIVQYVLPLSLIGLAYIRIGRDLRRDKSSYSNDALQREQERDAHKVVKLLTVVVIVFAILMLPNHATWIWHDFGTGNKNIMKEITPLCQILVYANSASNPLIYNACNSQFREGFKNYFRAWLSCFLWKHSGRLNNSSTQNGRTELTRQGAGCEPTMDDAQFEATRQEKNCLCNNNKKLRKKEMQVIAEQDESEFLATV